MQQLYTKIFLEDELYEPVSVAPIKDAAAKKYIDEIVAKLLPIGPEIIKDQDGKIIVMAEEDGFNYCLNGFHKDTMRRIIDRLDQTEIAEGN